jgi:hypothetical protein
MPNFDSGVLKYIIGRYTVEVGFPVDFKGNADISCKQCPYFRRTYSTCGLNGTVCAYPDKYVGDHCPLEREE